MKTVLSMFDFTGNVLTPWRDAGYECWAVDIQHRGDHVRDGIRYIEADMRDWIAPHNAEYAVVFAWPPCTHLAVSGARWFSGKGLGALRDSVDLFSRAARQCEAIGAPYLIENPVSTMSTYWRKPDYTFHPWHYGDNESKQTCLWTGGGFVMPEPETTTRPPGVRQSVWLCPPSPERANIRSATPMGFARAVFLANTDPRAGVKA